MKIGQKGFTLVEVLVAVAILGITISVINQFIFSTYFNIRLLQAEAVVKPINANIDTFLNSNKACMNSLIPYNPMADNKVITNIRNPVGAGTVAYSVGNTFNFNSNTVTLSNITVQNLNVTGTNANFNLVLTYGFNSGSVVNIVKMINIDAVVDGANNIITCNSFRGLNPESLFVKVNGNEIKTGGLAINGNLNVGQNALDSSSLHVIDDPAGSPRNTTFFSSDRSLKKDISLLSDFTQISLLNAYRYQFKDSKVWRIGFLASEVEKVAPHAVTVDNNGHKLVSYKSLIPYVWEYHRAVLNKQKQLSDRLSALEQNAQIKN